MAGKWGPGKCAEIRRAADRIILVAILLLVSVVMIAWSYYKHYKLAGIRWV